MESEHACKRREPEAIRALKAKRAAATTAAAEPAESAPAKPSTSGQLQDPDTVIEPGMIAYLFMKEWWRARQRGDFDFMYALTTDDGPLREHFGDRDAFPEVCRRKMRPVVGVDVGELCRVRLNGSHEAHVIQAYGERERERRKYDLQRALLLTDKGWRVHQVDAISVDRGTPRPTSRSTPSPRSLCLAGSTTWRDAQAPFVNPKPAEEAAAASDEEVQAEE